MNLTLVVMAAGMGSRFGGCKQMTPVDPEGHVMLDYSAYDALRSGFEHVVFVIKPEMEKDFREVIGDRIAGKIDVRYAYQTLDSRLPSGCMLPEGRTKPWGTAHAVLSAKDVIGGDFVAVNADDFYGRGAYEAAARFLKEDRDQSHHAMVGYKIENTLTENGYVSRGVCETDADCVLTRITERVHIVPREGGAAYIEEGQDEVFLPNGTFVSMNFWAFRKGILDDIEEGFGTFFDTKVRENPLKAEYYLPSVPDRLIREGRAQVRVLPTHERWYGMTYHEDLEKVRASLRAMKDKGIYPEKLWE